MDKKKDPNKNWIRLNRALLDSWVWNTGDPFTPGQAWVDLLLLAYYADDSYMYRGKYMQVKRGQIPYSMRFFAERWKWSRGKVSRFMNALEADGAVSIERATNGTLVTVENYTFWQGDRTENEPQTGHGRDTYGTQTGHGRTQNKNIKNIRREEGKNIYTAPTLPEIREYVSTHALKVIPAAFFNYYEARGWRTPSGPITDWRAQLRFWDQNKRTGHQSKGDELEAQYSMAEEWAREE